MKKITMYDIYLVEKVEEIIRDICFIVVDTNEFAAEMTDDYFREIQEELFDAINESGYTQYDYVIENV